MKEYLDDLDTKLAVAGLAGALVAIAIRPTKTVWGGFLTLFAGLACSVYVTPLINHFLSLPENLYGGLGFLTGLASLPMSGWLLRNVSRLLDKKFNDSK